MTRVVQSIMLIGLVFILGAAGCNKGSVPIKSDTSTIDLSDDLSKYRPRYEAPQNTVSDGSNQIEQNRALEVTSDLSEKLNVALDTVAARNDSLGFVQGYSILVYSGSSRTTADRTRNRLFDIVDPDDIQRLDYDLPNWFVRVGQFYEQIEAQALYLKIIEYYPTSTIVPQKFPLRK